MEPPFDSIYLKTAVLGSLVLLRVLLVRFSPLGANGQRSEATTSNIALLDSISLTLGVIFLVVQPFFLQPFYIPSGSMENTLPVNDRLVVSKWIYHFDEPKFQDVVVFRAPDASGSGGDDFIKRCIGTPGHVIEIKKGQLFRDGRPVFEPYPKLSQPPQTGIYSYDMKIVGGKIYSREYVVSWNTPNYWTAAGQFPQVVASNQDYITNAKAETVPTGYLLMLGDNRHNSNDSHAWGFVPRENVVGKAVFVFWPPAQIGLLDKKSRVVQNPNFSKLAQLPVQ